MAQKSHRVRNGMADKDTLEVCFAIDSDEDPDVLAEVDNTEGRTSEDEFPPQVCKNTAKKSHMIIGQKRMTALSYFTKKGKPVPGEKRAVFLARMREEWSRLGEENKKIYKGEARLYKRQPPQTENDKTAYLRRVCSELNELADFMKKQLGWSLHYQICTGTSTVDTRTGPGKPTPIFPPPMPTTHITPAPIPPTPKQRPPKDEERTSLRKEVQNLFNDLYAQATGRRGNFPYKKHRLMPELAVTGMPHGVLFKEPYSYGLPALKAILVGKNHIKMHMVQASLSENVAPVTPGEGTTAAVGEASQWQQLTCLDAFPLENGNVPVVAEVTHMDIAAPGTGDIVAPPPQENPDVPVNVKEAHPLAHHVKEAHGVLDVSAILASNLRPLDETKASSLKKAGTKKCTWTAEEVQVIQEHFADELHSRRRVCMKNIKNFLSNSNFKRTEHAVQNYLLRNRKEDPTKENLGR